MIIGLYSDHVDGGYLPKTTHHTTAPFFGTLNLAVRREVINEIGGFDEALALGEDIDLCIRANLTRWRLFSAPEARVQHVNRPTVRGLMKQWAVYGFWHASLYKKHNGRALEVLVHNPSRGARVRYGMVHFNPDTRFAGLVFLSSLWVGIALAVVALGAAGLGLSAVASGAGWAAAAAGLVYLRDDLRYDVGLADRFVVAWVRLMLNLAHGTGGLVGGVHHGFFYLCGTLWKSR